MKRGVDTIKWKLNKVWILDQTVIPFSKRYIVCSDYLRVARAIKTMEIRGAPAIGIAGAMGFALGAMKIKTTDKDIFFRSLKTIAKKLIVTRPTAYNLEWAVNRLMALADKNRDKSLKAIKDKLIKEANIVLKEDIAMNRKIGDYGASLIKKGSTMLTHCNAGALATGGYGTALGVIRSAWKQKKIKKVFVDETRPRLQGAMLTAFELTEEKIPAVLISDNMAGSLMSRKEVDAVVVGADRIAANGDAANKIGTYPLAVLAKYHGVPFYVAAPGSTIDPSIKTGSSIVIEERDHKEMLEVRGKRIAPAKIKTINPAFDVTPHKLITAIITEKGVVRNPDRKRMERVLGNGIQ